MAAQEPKITRLAPGEGAGSFKRKSGPDNKPGGGNTRNRTPKGQRRTQNPAILSDGSVDPKSKQYQRSVAGREKLEDYVKRLDAQGADERDIFMAAVNSLKNRGHGYVGAYLDSKNPSRRYNDVQAKAIADSVMSKANVGENPGARLTKPDKDTKEAQADKRAASKESGSAPEPGRKAMPVGQQRKQPGGRGGGAGMPETWAKGDTGVELTTPEAREREAAGWRGFDPAVSDAKRPELSKKSQQQQAQRGQKKEKGSKEDQGPETAAQRFQKSLKQEPQPTQAQGKQLDELLAKREEMEPEEFEQAFKQLMEAVKTGEGGQREALRQYIDGIKGKGVRAPLPGSSAAANRDEAIEKEQAAGKEQQELRQKQAQAGREEAKKRRQAEKEAEADRRIEEEIPVDEEVSPEEKAKSQASDDQIAGAFRAKYNDAKKYSLEAAIRVARENRQVAPKSVELDAEQIEYLAQETIEDLSEEFEVDPGKAIAAINKKFGLKIPVPEQEQPSTAPGPKTTTEQPQASKDVKYTKPNFQKEWDEANRYPEFESAGIEGWKKAAEKGTPVKYSQIQDQLGNVDLDYDSLEGEKKQRFEQAFQQGQIETPIAVRFDDGSYDLVAGNTRLSGLVKNGVDPSIWVVDVKDLEQVPAREKLPEERLGKGKAPAPARGGGGFTPEVKAKAKTAIKQAVAEGKTAQQLVEEYKQGTLFPGGLATDTAATNPLEGGRTPEPTQESPELAPSSSLPDESRPVAESPGQKTFLRKGSETSKKPQILPSSIQVPKPAQGVTDAQSYTKQLQKANIPSAMINKAVKDTYGSRSAKRRRGTTSSSEYQQFSDAVRQVVKLRSAQLVKSH
jgi:hypothetical protein